MPTDKQHPFSELNENEGWKNAVMEEKLTFLEMIIYKEIRKTIFVRKEASVLAGFVYKDHSIDIYIKRKSAPAERAIYKSAYAYDYKWKIDGKVVSKGSLFSDAPEKKAHIALLPSIARDLALFELAGWNQAQYENLKLKWDRYSL